MKKSRRKLSKKGKKIVFSSIIILLVVLIVGGGFIYRNFMAGSGNGYKPEPEVEVEEPTINIVDLNSTARPLAVVINNISVARPAHSGLQDAYLIYEVIVEGGITRYLALFHEADTERIGSVRSARHYMLDYVLENDAVFVYHGQSPQAGADMSSLGIDRVVVSAGTTGFRDNNLRMSSEHRLFTSIAQIESGLGNIRRERNRDFLLNYSVELIDLSELEGAIPANSVSIRYSTSLTTSYEFDVERKVYTRFINGNPHVDFVTEQQLHFKNIITYQVRNQAAGGGGRQTLSNIGNGTGWFISNGYAVPITWEKSTRSAQTIYRLADGTPLYVNDGNTFIQIQPVGTNPVIE